LASCMRGIYVRHLRHLLGGDFGQLFATVANVDHPQARHGIDVALAIDVFETDALALSQDQHANPASQGRGSSCCAPRGGPSRDGHSPRPRLHPSRKAQPGLLPWVSFLLQLVDLAYPGKTYDLFSGGFVGSSHTVASQRRTLPCHTPLFRSGGQVILKPLPPPRRGWECFSPS
jgi:hypothetical protein